MVTNPITGKPLLLLDSVKLNRDAFGAKVIQIASALGIPNPDYLMGAMNIESSINPSAVNPTTGATGLIQFMPGTARALGTTVEALKQMSNVQQLDYVYKYFFPYKGKLNTFADVYLTIFYPAAVGKPDYQFPDIVMKQNPTFAKFLINGNLKKASIENYLHNRFPGLTEQIIKGGTTLAVLLVICVVIYLIVQP